MDIWVVAAAAGAAYMGQHWKNLVSDRQFLSDSSQQIQGKSCPFHNLVQRIIPGKDDVFTEGKSFSDGASTEEGASTSGSDEKEPLILCNHEYWNVLSISCLSPKFLSNDDPQGDRGVISGDIDENSNDFLVKTSTSEVGGCYGFSRKRSVLRSRRTNLQSLKPPSSGQSCLVAQLHKERAAIEECVVTCSTSASTTARPYSMNDGSTIINKANGDFYLEQTGMGRNVLYKEIYPEGKYDVLGVPPLPNLSSAEVSRKNMVKMSKELGGTVSSSEKTIHGKLIGSKRSSDGALLFRLGIAVGIISSYLENKHEVNKLNELLKQTETFVQDLQEELEMKDSLIVKELAIENSESQSTHDYNDKGAPCAFSSEWNLEQFTKNDCEEFHDQTGEVESLSKIEAELEAELERLELNMNSASLEAKLSDPVEVDQYFIADVVQGELRANMFGKQGVAQPYADQDGSNSFTPHSATYAVSPRELSLRLHEVLQLQLEERIKELETALEYSRGKVQYIESEGMISRTEFTYCEAGTSIRLSPIAKKEQNIAEPPVVINLWGEALDLYNEAYDEFSKIESEEEDLPSGIGNDFHQESLVPFDCDQHWVQNGSVNSYTPGWSLTKGNSSMKLLHQKGEDHITLSNDFETSGDESDNHHNEIEEEILIKEIVEKTRKGFPVVLNAQRALFLSERNDHSNVTTTKGEKKVLQDI